MSLRHAVAVVLLCVSSPSAQVAWTLRTPTSKPSARYVHAMAYDETRAKTVLFGGLESLCPECGTLVADTWEWDGALWTRPAPASSPPPMENHAMCYDSARRRVVLFGGWAARGGSLPPDVSSDTYEWDGTAWSKRAPAHVPPARESHLLVFDSRRARCVLIGGSGSGSYARTDVWEWDGTDWTQMTSIPVTTSSTAYAGAATFDRARGVALVLPLNQTVPWEWDGVQWRPGVSVPRQLYAAVACYDSARRRSVFFNNSRELWEYDGATWQQRAAAAAPPFGLTRPALAYDSTRQRAVLFGGMIGGPGPGRDETWEYGPTVPASLSSYANGCTGSVGVPQLSADGDSLPWIGDNLALRIANLPPGRLALLLAGASRAHWLGYALPLDLTPIGMNGCALAASGELQVPFVRGGGVGGVLLTIPSQPALLGAAFYTQCLVDDLAANPFGMILSNASEARIGGR